MEIQHFGMLSPVGKLIVSATSTAIKMVRFAADDFTEPLQTGYTGDQFLLAEECKSQLQAYFTSKLKYFQLPLEPDGTVFQKRVWSILHQIPFGITISYAQLANKLGDKNLIRAVGSANAKNPIAIIIPCHRVIGTSGDLTGYAGGLWRKKFLLDLEQPEKQALLF